MGIADRIWDGLTTVVKMNDRVERLSATVKHQQDKIENLTERLIRLETALELGLSKPRAIASNRRIEGK